MSSHGRAPDPLVGSPLRVAALHRTSAVERVRVAAPVWRQAVEHDDFALLGRHFEAFLALSHVTQRRFASRLRKYCFTC